MFWQPFSEEEEKLVVDAITSAERQFSGEIRIHVERYCKSNPFARARTIFQKLDMTNTRDRNGVLIYFGLEDHNFAILGDKGINDLVPENFWESTKEAMMIDLRANDVIAAICRGIELSAAVLKEHFPPKEDDTNELSNEISYGS